MELGLATSDLFEIFLSELSSARKVTATLMLHFAHICQIRLPREVFERARKSPTYLGPI